MDSLNVSFEILDRTSTPLDDLNLDIRDIVIWNTGSADGNGLSAVEKNVIMEYLDSGKNLFLSGSHLGEELADSELLNNYFEMRYAGFRTGGILRGVEGDPIGVNSDNKLFLSLGSVGIDSLSTFGDPRASLSFYYNGDESHGAVMRYSSPDYRVILSSFNMDAVSPPNSTFLSEKDYIYSVLNYLVSDVEYPDVPTLLLPAAGYADTLTSSDDNISFSWNSSDLEGINYLRGIDDAESLKDGLLKSKNLVIVGAGYIGLEVAAVATEFDTKITVIEMADRVMNRTVDPIISAYYQELHSKNGVDFILNESLEKVDGNKTVEQVICSGGSSIEADILVIGAGVIPNIELAEESGLSCDNGICVDEYGQTEDTRILACGDCTNHPNEKLNRKLRLESVHNYLF